MSDVIVVGGSGYIGRHMKKILPDFHYLSSADMNILSRGSVIKYLKNKDVSVCIVLAAKIAYGMETDVMKEPFLTNVSGLNILLSELKLKNSNTKIIYFSSMTVYSPECGENVTENADLAPFHAYGLSKVYAEQLIKYHGMPSAVIRIPGIYGGDRQGGYIYNSIKKIASGEAFAPDFTGIGYWETMHIDDMLDMFADFYNNYNFDNKFDVFNLSYGEETDLVKTAEYIKAALESKSDITPSGEYYRLYLSNAKIGRYAHPHTGYYERLSAYIRETA